MTAAKIRVGGAWVDATKAGKVRIAGNWVDFGPAGGPTLEGISWPNEPTSLNLDDGGGSFYNMGLGFYLLAAKTCYGARWRVPTSAPAPTGGHCVSLWDRAAGTLMETKDFTPVAGGYQDVLFDTPRALAASPTQYVITVFTFHYVYSAPTPPSTWTLKSPSLNLVAEEGRLNAGSKNTYPGSTPNAWYYVSPLVEV